MTNNDDLALNLKARYSEPEAPKCRICGAEMSIQRAGGGSIVYGCDGRVDGDGYAFKEGRSFADKHYEQSRETVYNHGDPDVIEMLAERDADKAENAQLRQRVAELETICAESYQVVGALADAAGVFETSDAVSKALDNLSDAKLVHEDVLPFAVEARTVTVKLPEHPGPMSVGAKTVYCGIVADVVGAFQTGLAAAGINLEVEE